MLSFDSLTELIYSLIIICDNDFCCILFIWIGIVLISKKTSPKKTDMPRTFDYPPALKKEGLQPTEFKQLVKNKLARILECNEKDFQSSINESIQEVITCCCIRECTTNPGKLDERNRGTSILQMRKEGYLIDETETSPSSIEAQVRPQGSDLPNKRKVRKVYHKKQRELFSALEEQYELNTGFDDNGYLLDSNGARCTTEDMCNILDSITKEYIGESQQADSTEMEYLSPVTIQNDGKSLEKILKPCKSIVLGRIYVDWVVENDILSEDGYKKWKQHVCALASFTSLLVSIDVQYRLPKYGSNSILRSV